MNLVSWLLVVYLIVQTVNAADGCSISGKDNVCCTNSGVGPQCAYCTEQCQVNVKGDACDTSHSSCNSVVDCTNQLTAITSGEPDMTFTSYGTDAVSVYSWKNYFTNAAETNCPTFQCFLRKQSATDDVATTMSKYGVMFQNTDADAFVIHNDEPGTEVPFTSVVFYMYCFTYYDASAADPEATSVQSDDFIINHYDGCYSSASFPAVASPQGIQLLQGSQTDGYTNVILKAFQVTEYISKLKSTCVLQNCRWLSYSWGRCKTSTTNPYAPQTDDAGNGLDFTSYWQTSNAASGGIACLYCQAVQRSGSTIWIISNELDFNIVGCNNFVSVINPQSHTFYLADTSASGTVTLFSSWTDFFSIHDANYISNCQPTLTQIYTSSTFERSCDESAFYPTNYAYIQCQGTNIGNMYVHRSKIITTTLRIKIKYPGYTATTSYFTIDTQCGPNSTTISEPPDIETTQQFQIHTGDYWNAPQRDGYLPNFWFSPYQNTQSLCAISTYEIITSSTNETAPTLLTLSQDSLSSKKYVWVDDSVKYKIDSYNFTIKVTASGGAIFFTDFSVSTVYDCIYDNITLVRKLPTIVLNPRVEDMIMIGDHPVTYVNRTVGDISNYDLVISSLFINNASDYCPIEQYNISKVVNFTSGQELQASDYETRMQFQQSKGLWEFIDMSSEFFNVDIYFQAYNGKIWSDSQLQQLIQINLNPKPLTDEIAPIFKGALFPIELTLDKLEHPKRDWSQRRWSSQKLLQYTMPEIIEEVSLPISVQFDSNGAKFVTYDQKSNNLTIDQSQITTANEGTNEVKFVLMDALENQKEYSLVIEIAFEKKAKNDAVFEFIPQFQQQIEEVKQEILEDEVSGFKNFEQADDPFMMSTKADNNGSIYINFGKNQLMVADEFRNELNFKSRLLKATQMEKVFQLQVLPSADRDPLATGSKLDFTFESYTIENNKTLIIKIEFESPDDVSISTYSDRLKLKINKSQFEKTFIILSGSRKKIEIPDTDEPLDAIINIPAQLPKEKSLQNVQANTESAQDGLKNSGLFNLALSYLMNASFSLIWSALNTLQIISFMVVSKIRIPAVSNILYEKILQLVTFDVIPEQYYSPVLEYLFDDLPSDYVYQDQVAQAGFQTGYILVSMFTVFAFVSIFLLKALVNWFIFMTFRNVRYCQKRAHKSEEQIRLVPAEFLRLSIELCMDISVCSFIEILMRQVNTFQERISYHVSIFLLLIFMIGLFYSIYLMKTQKNKINHPKIFAKFHSRWGTIWEDQVINFDQFLPCFNIFFVIRRFVYASILIYAISLQNFTVYLQLVSILLLNLLSTIYLVQSRRFISRKQQRIETFNETVNLLISIQFLALLQISDGKTLTQYGLGLNFSILFLFTINVFFVFGNVFQDFYKKIRAYFEKRANEKRILKEYYQKEVDKVREETRNKDLKSIERLISVKNLIQTNQKILRLQESSTLLKNRNNQDGLEVSNQDDYDTNQVELDGFSSLFSKNQSQISDKDFSGITQDQIDDVPSINELEQLNQKQKSQKTFKTDNIYSPTILQNSNKTNETINKGNAKNDFDQIGFSANESQLLATMNKKRTITPISNSNQKLPLYGKNKFRNRSITADKYKLNTNNMGSSPQLTNQNQDQGQQRPSSKIHRRIDAYLAHQKKQSLKTIQERTIEHDLDSNTNR